MLWPTAIQLTRYLHHVLGLYWVLLKAFEVNAGNDLGCHPDGESKEQPPDRHREEPLSGHLRTSPGAYQVLSTWEERQVRRCRWSAILSGVTGL